MAGLEVSGNPLAVLTFISAPAVLTNASCVLLFGTGNRYGRAIDRVHELAEMIEAGKGLEEEEMRLRMRQLEAGEARAGLIVRALTCFYTAVAGFVGSTLVALIGAVLGSMRMGGQAISFGVAFAAGSVGVLAVMAGAGMLARETVYSFRVLREERSFLAKRVAERVARLGGRSAGSTGEAISTGERG